MSHMGPYLKSFLPYAQKRMGFNRPPTIFFDSDPQNAENVLGKTAYYNPETEEIVVFVDKRHPKDILRSLSHELIHHTQNCRGDLNPEIAGETTPGYAQTNAHMRAMEGEAYLKGNGYYFRDWEDSLKNGLEETNYKHITGDTHKMATYDQLKEEITAKVVAALTEKLKGDKDGDGDEDFADIMMSRRMASGESEEEAREASRKHNETNERKKRDTPRDSDRREAEKLKINEEELDEAHCGDREDEEELEEAHCGAREDDKETPEELEESLDEKFTMPAQAKNISKTSYKNVKGSPEQERAKRCAKVKDDMGYFNSQEFLDARNQIGSDAESGPNLRLDPRDTAKEYAKCFPEDADRSAMMRIRETELVEETISNDEWYQNELFESLKKRWTK